MKSYIHASKKHDNSGIGAGPNQADEMMVATQSLYNDLLKRLSVDHSGQAQGEGRKRREISGGWLRAVFALFVLPPCRADSCSEAAPFFSFFFHPQTTTRWI